MRSPSSCYLCALVISAVQSALFFNGLLVLTLVNCLRRTPLRPVCGCNRKRFKRQPVGTVISTRLGQNSTAFGPIREFLIVNIVISIWVSRTVSVRGIDVPMRSNVGRLFPTSLNNRPVADLINLPGWT